MVVADLSSACSPALFPRSSDCTALALAHGTDERVSERTRVEEEWGGMGLSVSKARRRAR